MSNWVGFAVSVNCGETLGCYQGTIAAADGATITLTKAFRNGFPYPKSQVTLNAADIKDLRIIEAQAESPAPALPAPAAAPSRRSRATVCETLQANSSSTGNQQTSNNAASNSTKSPNNRSTNAAPNPARSKPLDIQGSRKNNNMHTAGTGSYGSGSTPRSRAHFGGRGEPGAERARRRNEACFGDAADTSLLDDFDFEGNLALFDKRAVWASMRSSRPDVVRAADDSKYRHDENVLGAAPDAAALRVPPELRAPADYVTDGGALVPCVGGATRLALWRALRRHGLADGAMALVARAAVDVALRLVGGARRLEARNAHQAPRVVALVGAHRAGAAALSAARLLASRGARVAVHVLDEGESCAELRRELAALALDGVRPAPGAEAPDGAADLVLAAPYCPLEDRLAACAPGTQAWWAARSGATLVLEPAGGGWAGGGARACVVGGLAVPLPEALGRVYLADVAAPRALLAALGLEYRPPYGALPALPLHPHP